MAENSETCALNDLFTQILNSEEKIRERFSKLRSINLAIQEAQIRIREVQNELKSFRGSYVVKTNRLADEEQKLKWLKIRRNVMKDKRKDLQEKNVQLQERLNKLKESSESKRTVFISDVCEFLSFHDLTGNGKQNRENEGTLKLDEIGVVENQLRLDLEALKVRQRGLSAVRKQKDQLVGTENSLQKYHKGLVYELSKEKRATALLEADKMEAYTRPQQDQEFRRLGAELEAARDGSMEGICEALAQELKELQQTHLKREMQKQKCLQQKGKGDTKRNTYQNRDRGRSWRYELNRKLEEEMLSDENFADDNFDQDIIELSP